MQRKIDLSSLSLSPCFSSLLCRSYTRAKKEIKYIPPRDTTLKKNEKEKLFGRPRSSAVSVWSAVTLNTLSTVCNALLFVFSPSELCSARTLRYTMPKSLGIQRQRVRERKGDVFLFCNLIHLKGALGRFVSLMEARHRLAGCL
ncbi:hypothetical protein M5K25_020790 [Dendrobium thyrsiflorum]|uniref:Uncharacterized protein n=1 Tax=Dendrobium thyrsiflorum TaxID=117978 RepID=A0ABD0UHQ5_DENTH